MASAADKIMNRPTDFLSPKFINTQVSREVKESRTLIGTLGGNGDLLGKNPDQMDILRLTKDGWEDVLSMGVSTNAGSIFGHPAPSNYFNNPAIAMMSGTPRLQGNLNPALWQNPQTDDIMYGTMYAAQNVLNSPGILPPNPSFVTSPSAITWFNIRPSSLEDGTFNNFGGGPFVFGEMGLPTLIGFPSIPQAPAFQPWQMTVVQGGAQQPQMPYFPAFPQQPVFPQQPMVPAYPSMQNYPVVNNYNFYEAPQSNPLTDLLACLLLQIQDLCSCLPIQNSSET